MFMEGDVDWTLVLGLTAAISTVVAILALVFAWTNRTRHVSTSDELTAVSRARQDAETRLYETLNAIPVALVQTDRGGKFVFANRAAHQLLGRKDAELVGLRFHSATWGITYPDGRPVPPDLLPSARALRGQTVKGFQHILANPATRRKMLVSVTAMPIEDALGQVIGSTAAIVETEGLTTPEATPLEPAPAPADPNATVRRVFEAASSALVVVAANGVIREANRTALDLFDRAADVVGLDFADQFLGEMERVEGRQTLRAAAAGAQDADVIASTRGGERGVTWRLLPLTAADGTVDALLLASDPVPAEAAPMPAPMPAPEPESEPSPSLGEIETERAAAIVRETQLAAERDAALSAAESARAEAARALDRGEGAQRLESVGRLTGGVAQDFNALLAVMTSALDMMLKAADDPARVRRLGQAALAAGQRGEALTRRLAAFSQGEATEARALDAGVLLRAMESRLRALAGPGVDLMIEAPQTEAPVRVDPVGFEGAVTALVRNAVEAVDGAGSVAVRLEPLDDGEVRLTVRDTGPGLDDATAARALEPFFTTRPGAAGLGLSQAHAFARLSGGRLTLDNVPDAGAEATLTLPPPSQAA